MCVIGVMEGHEEVRRATHKECNFKGSAGEYQE